MSNAISNRYMQNALEELRYSSACLSEDTVRSIKKFLEIGFVEWDRCVLLNFEWNQRGRPESFIPTDLIIDRTQIEATINHLFISEISDETRQNPLKALMAARKIASEWELVLMKEYPNDNFRIVISQDEVSTSIRLYKSRVEEVGWIREDNLEAYQHEAVSLIKISACKHR